MKPKVEMVKTSLRLPRDVWRAARLKALDERMDFQDLVAKALEAYCGNEKTVLIPDLSKLKRVKP